MAWYESAVLYHIYPLGLCGCPQENHGETGSGFATMTAWADHARAMHCTCLYLGPVFQSLSHGYDTTDYRLVDTRLGTNEELAALVRHCHENGMKVIVDGVFNHVGRAFSAFRDVQQNRENSPYAGWFCDLNFGANNEYNDGFSYGNWGGYNCLVKLNLKNPAVREYHYDTVRRWVKEFDIDGIRLDTADVLDFDFLRGLRAVTDTLKPDFWLMGEVMNGDYGRWVAPGVLHSVTNYAVYKALWSGHNDHNYFETAHTIRYVRERAGEARLVTFADNHDVARIESKLTDKANFLPLSVLHFTIPGVPSIYYGSEFGVEADKQRDSDWNLRPELSLEALEADEAARAHRAFCAALGKLKQTRAELSFGDYRELLLTNRQFAFARIQNGRACVTVMNNDDAPARMELALPCEAQTAADGLPACKTGVCARAENGKLTVELPANKGTVLLLGN
jgi:cyclomaltodextrinase